MAGGHRVAQPGYTVQGLRRRAARHELETLERDGDVSSDELERAEKELEKLTHEQIAEIDKLLSHKERELLEL